MAKTEIVNTSFNCQNKILYIQNLMHIYKYILTTFVSLTCIFFFFELPFWRVGKSQRKFLGGGEEKVFSSIILERDTEIFMIQK